MTMREDPIPPPRWRLLAAEAVRRGYPSARALRDHCRALGVEVRGHGKHQAVRVDDLDAMFDRMPPADHPAPTPPTPPGPTRASLDLAAAHLMVRARG